MSKSEKRIAQQAAAVSRRADRQQAHAQMMLDHTMARLERVKRQQRMDAYDREIADVREMDPLGPLTAHELSLLP